MSDSKRRRLRCPKCLARKARMWSYFNNLMIHCPSCHGELHSGAIYDRKDVVAIKARLTKRWMAGERNTMGDVMDKPATVAEARND